MPSARNWCRIASAVSSSRISTASVISISSRLAGRPEAASAPAIFSASVGHFSCTGETLTAIRTWRGPGGGLGAGGSQHPFAEFDDQAGIFRDGDEFGRRDHAALGMAPAQQRLAAGDLVARQIDQRLVVDLEAAVDQRLAQVALHGEPGLGAGIHVGLEEAIGPPPAGLGAVHRQIGVLDQLVEVGAVLRRQRDADAGVGRSWWPRH